MNHARRLRRMRALAHGPGAHFLRADGEKGQQPQQPVTGADDAVQARLVQPHVGEEGLFLFVAHVGELHLDGRRHRHHRRLLLLRALAHCVEIGIIRKSRFAHVGDVHERLVGEQAQRPEQQMLLGAQFEAAHRQALIELGAHSHQQLAQLGLVLAAGLGAFVRTRHPLFHGLQIGKRELGVDGLDIGDGIDAAGHVHHVLVLEAAHHVGDGIHLADVGQKLVTEALALRRAGDETGDVHELDGGREDFLGLGDRRELVQARVWHLDDADVRIDGAERIVLGRNAGLGQRVEERGLADVGQADNTAFKTH